MCLKVGAAKRCIDPPEDMFPAYSRISKCEAIHDPCYCRAISIDNGERRLMFLIYELSDQPDIPELKTRISAASGFSPSDIIIAVTHNHTAPGDVGFNDTSDEQRTFRAKYKDIELSAGISACVSAASSMRPARCGFGQTDSFINVNRNFQTLYNYWATAANFGGYSIKTLSMIKFVDMEGKLIAALLNHGTHATMALELMPLDTAKDFDGKRKLSGNLPGLACKFVEDYYEGSVVAWTSAAAGDQGPILSDMQFQYPDGYTSCVKYPDGVSYQQMEYLAGIHGADAVRGIEAIDCCTDSAAISHVSKNVFLPAQVSDRRGPFRMGGIGVRQPGDVPEYPYIPKRSDDPEHPIEMCMQLVTLGDIAIVCAGAELYSRIGQDIIAASPFKNTFVITHTEDKGHVGYVPDRLSVDELVFQNFSKVKPGASDEIILSCAKDMFSEISMQ
ncbi:MAG: hypothetical protein ACI3VB_02590 [Oscillospiraceae bacterium]